MKTKPELLLVLPLNFFNLSAGETSEDKLIMFNQNFHTQISFDLLRIERNEIQWKYFLLVDN